jgi:hypothetical protein
MNNHQATILITIALIHLAIVYYLVKPSNNGSEIVDTVSDGLTTLLLGSL